MTVSCLSEDHKLNEARQQICTEENQAPFGSSISSITNKRGLRCGKELWDLPRFSKESITTYKLIGSGSFSNVYQANSIDSGKWYAIKRSRESKLAEEMSSSASSSKSDLLLEAAILSSLNQENIITLHGISDGNICSSIKSRKFYLVLDLLEETLHDRLLRWKKERNIFFRFRRLMNQEDTTMAAHLEDVALGIATGMDYLHSKHIIFRDLKPTNVGFDALTGKVKIFDFGLSRECYDDNTSVEPRRMTLRVGTPRYMAPEVMKGKENYSFPVDVYSFGILLWQLFTNRKPFENISSITDLVKKVAIGSKRPALKYIKCAEIRKILKLCWSVDPVERPSFCSIRKMLEDKQTIDSMKNGLS